MINRFFIILCLGLLLGNPFHYQQAHAQNNVQSTGGTIQDIIIRGAKRSDGLSLLSYLPLQIGDPFQQDLMDDALKALYATGAFSNVALTREGGNLIITISEQPIINKIVFEGNNAVEVEALMAEMQTRERQTYNEARIQSDVRKLINLYQRFGRYAIRIEPKIIELPQNRINLVLEIAEGRKTSIHHIAFIGNNTFSDERIQDEIFSRERRFLRFFGTNYDPELIAGDRQAIQRFYRNSGFPDIDITAANTELARGRQYFLMSFSINEGTRFKIADISLTSDIINLDIDDKSLQKVLKKSPLQSEDWYHSDEIDNIQYALIQAGNALGFPFIDVVIEENRNSETSTIDLVFKIVKAPKKYIERIDIVGNTRTLDKVIRRRLAFTEGDAFIQSKVNRAERDLRFTGFFESVRLFSLPGTKADNIILRIAVKEKLTGVLSFGFGYGSFSGASLRFGITERNFGGRGNSLGFEVNYSEQVREYRLNLNQPFYRGLPLTFYYSLFKEETKTSSNVGYDKVDQGGSVGINYQIGSSYWQHSFGYNASQTLFDNILHVASRDSRGNVTLTPVISEENQESFTSSVSQSFVRDTRNKQIGATDGSRIFLSQTYAGLGGDSHYVQTDMNLSAFRPLTRHITGSARLRGSTINETSGRLSSTNGFITGGRYLRGFEYGGVGPTSASTGLHVPVTDYLTNTLEVFFPIGFPPEANVVGTLFHDAGIMKNTDYDHGTVMINDEETVRAAWGYGIVWRAPIGIIKVEWYRPYRFEQSDFTDRYEFSLGVGF